MFEVGKQYRTKYSQWFYQYLYPNGFLGGEEKRLNSRVVTIVKISKIRPDYTRYLVCDADRWHAWFDDYELEMLEDKQLSLF